MYRGERMNSITHLLGVVLAIVGLIFLVVRAALTGDPWKIVSCSIYGGTLVTLYTSSTLYHSIQGASKKVFQKFDHSAIYLLIAGSYTPFTLVTLRGAWGWSLFAVVWGLAVIGILQDILFAKRRSILSVIIYLLMGWIAMVAIRPLSRALPGAGMTLLVAGGLFYTIGVVFYALDKKIVHSHGIWHLFVLAGSACHFFTIFMYVA
jgi:hemolysin III